MSGVNVTIELDLPKAFSVGGLKLKFNEDELFQIGQVVEASILQNILTQRQADGQPLQRNTSATLALKKRLGRPRLSLVNEKRRFVKGREGSWWISPNVMKQTVSVKPRTAELARLVEYTARKGYTGYIGINREAVRNIKRVILNGLKRIFQDAKRLKG